MLADTPNPPLIERSQSRRQICAVCGSVDCGGARNLCCNCLETAIAVLELLAADERQSRPAYAPAVAILQFRLRQARHHAGGR